jgi:anti-sigma regulatory factor (Ser/Thr protein kinase)
MAARDYVRELLSKQLGEFGMPLDDIELCLSELVANAWLHTESRHGGHIQVTVSQGRHVVRIEVVDGGGGASRPHVRNEPEAEGGRGMVIVEALSQRWDVDGRTTWCEFQLPDLLAAGEPAVIGPCH